MADKKITVNSMPLTGVPNVDQICTISYKKTSDPDSAFVVVTTTQVVSPAGVLQPALVIPNLDYSTSYTVRAVNNCEGIPVDKVFVTPAVTCPSITDIIGTAT